MMFLPPLWFLSTHRSLKDKNFLYQFVVFVNNSFIRENILSRKITILASMRDPWIELVQIISIIHGRQSYLIQIKSLWMTKTFPPSIFLVLVVYATSLVHMIYMPQLDRKHWQMRLIYYGDNCPHLICGCTLSMGGNPTWFR